MRTIRCWCDFGFAHELEQGARPFQSVLLISQALRLGARYKIFVCQSTTKLLSFISAAAAFSIHNMVLLSYVILFSCLLFAWSSAQRVITEDELKSKNGKDSDEMWLSILGQVYDVSSGKDYYGEGSPYHIFIGRDASASFVTGNFTEAGAKQSLLELDPPVKLTQLDDW